MKVLSGISVLALLIAGAATPSFATSLTPGGVVTPGYCGQTLMARLFVADTGVTINPLASAMPGGSVTVREVVVNNFNVNPFGASDLSFVYQITVTGGNIDNLTTESFAIPGLMLDVVQDGETLNIGAVPNTAATVAIWTSDASTVGFGFGLPDGLQPGDNSYFLIINTNLTNYEPGAFSLQDGQTQNFQGFVPSATPEPGSLALLGTGLLGVAGMARRKFFRA